MITKAVEILRTWEEGKELPPPEEVQIYPTNICNLRCVFCVTTTGIYKGQREVSKQRWLEVAQEICDMGVKRVLISGGGEPLISPATLPMMALFKNHNIHGRMINNGTMWKEEKILAAVRMGWDQITFSLDGPTREIHEKLRAVPGCFERTLSAIRRFAEVKLGMRKESPRLEINHVLNKENYRHIKKMVQLSIDLEIAHLNLEPICDNNPHVTNIRISEKEREELVGGLFAEAVELAEDRGLSTNIRGLMSINDVDKAGEMKEMILGQLGPRDSNRPLAELACYEPWLWPKIEANGEMWPCSTTPLEENIIERNFRDIWHGQVFTEYRKKITERNLPESCQNCVVSHLQTNRILREKMAIGRVRAS